MNNERIASELVRMAKDLVAREPLNPDIYLERFRKWRPESDYIDGYFSSNSDDLKIYLKEGDDSGKHKLTTSGVLKISIFDFLEIMIDEMDTRRRFTKADVKELMTYNRFMAEFRKLVKTKFHGQSAEMYNAEIAKDFKFKSGSESLDEDELRDLDVFEDLDGKVDGNVVIPVMLSGELKGNSFIIKIKNFGHSPDIEVALEETGIAVNEEQERRESYGDDGPDYDPDDYDSPSSGGRDEFYNYAPGFRDSPY